jgi:pimeloyl-ACP methyl ester carboxylesterase
VAEAILDGVRDLRLERSDRRIVSWSECGNEHGLPLLRVPGTPGSRYSLRADRTPWAQRHLRVITTERPGFGASSRLPERRFREPADDMAAILDQLELAAVHVVGGSGSAPHQLAFAAQHPDRVRAMTVLVGAAPPTEDEIAGMIGVNAEGHHLVRNGDLEGLRRLLDPIRTATIEDPTAAFRAVMDRAPDADRSVMADPSGKQPLPWLPGKRCDRVWTAGSTRPSPSPRHGTTST